MMWKVWVASVAISALTFLVIERTSPATRKDERRQVVVRAAATALVFGVLAFAFFWHHIGPIS